MHRAGLVNDFECQIAIDEPLHLVDKKLNFEAPHFVDYVLSQLGDGKDKAVRIVTTLDLGLQKDLQRLLSTTLESMKDYHVTQGAIIVMNAKSGEILAMIGSRDYFDGVEGQVNGCISSRQPGSSIKPFLYALAIQSGMRLSDMLPDTLIEFRLGDGTAFTPRNYGHRYHGPTRMREALASSFNVPAVYLIEQLGVHRFYELLKRLGFRGLDKDAAHYGLALSLGAAEVTLLELVNAYRVFAMEGNFNEAQALRAEYDQQGRQIRLTEHAAQRIFSIETAYLITDMLSDNAARFKAFDIDNALHLPFACAVKTGTSKDYRDNWCVGHTNKFAVGVWVGNFTGAPMQGVSGISGAAPLFRSVMLELHRDDDPGIFRCPETLVRRSICARSGKLAGSGCTNLIEETFIAGSEPRDTCTIHIRPGERRMHMAQHRAAKSTARQGIIILAPTPGDIYRIDPHVSRAAQQIRFRAASSSDEITRVIVKIDGKYLVTQNLPFEYLWTPSSGNHELQVIDQGNVMRSSAVEFIVN
jgi:penicillin-binding protein 1C